MDRSGYARGTLAPRPGMSAEVPPLDPRPLLTMADMMGMTWRGMASMARHGRHGMGMTASDATSAAAGMRPAKTAPTSICASPMPRSDLDDPGIGLRDNGRRVLTYADLHTLGGRSMPREPSATSSCT